MTGNYKLIRAFLIGTAVLGLASCSEISRQDTYVTDMSFSAEVGKVSTKVTETSWDGDETIGVKSGDEVKAYTVDAAGNMTVKDGVEPFQWNGEAFSLTAWYPYTDAEIDLADQTSLEKFFACDLLYSEVLAEQQSVTFNFSHKMARVKCHIQYYDGYTEEQVKAARISFFGYGKVSYHDGELTYSQDDGGQQINTMLQKGPNYWYAEAMLVPCEMWDKPMIQLEIGDDTYIYAPARVDDGGRNMGVLTANTWSEYFLNVNQGNFTVTLKAGDANSDGIDEWTSADKGAVTPDLQ